MRLEEVRVAMSKVFFHIKLITIVKIIYLLFEILSKLNVSDIDSHSEGKRGAR